MTVRAGTGTGTGWSVRRAWRLLGLAVRLQWRHRLVAVVAALTVGWSGLLLALPPATAAAAAPWVLVLETALLGTTLIGALVLAERDQGVLATVTTSPAGPGAYLAGKVAALTALVLGSAVPIALAARIDAGRLGPVLAAVGLLAVLSMLVAVAVAVRSRSGMAFMVALPLVLLPLLVPAVLHASGFGHPLWYAVPTTGLMDLVQGGYQDPALPPGPGAAALGWAALACLPAALVARHQVRRFATGPPVRAWARLPSGGARPASRRRARISRGPVRSFLRTDLVTVRRDPLLLLVGVSALPLALAVRFGHEPLHRWLLDTRGIDLDEYWPLLLAAVILLPAQTFGMVGALLVLDDAEDRALVALRTSPLTLPRYLGYRAGLVTVATLAGAAVVAVLSGLAAAAPWPRIAVACLLVSLCAPLTMLAALATARGKVEGVAVLRLLGLLLYLPLAGWWLAGPAGWLLAVLPTWWIAQTLWTSAAYAPAGGAVLAALLALSARRARVRLATR